MDEEFEKSSGLNIARWCHTIHHVEHAKFAYVIAGSVKSNHSKILTNCEKFDICNQKCSSFGELNTERWGAGSVIIGNNLFVFCGV